MGKKFKISISSMFMWILMLLQVKFFWIVPLSSFYSINGNQQQILMVIVMMMVFIVFKGKPFSYGTMSIKNYILFFVIYYMLELIISAIRNGQGLSNAFIASNFYLMILFYFVVLFFINRKGIKQFYHIVIWVSVINILVCWAQYILANVGIIFTHFDMSFMRFGNIRIVALSETITSLGVFLCFSYFLNIKNRKRWFYFVFFILGVLGHIIVSKGRVSMVALFIGCCVYLLIKYKKYLFKLIASISIILILVAVFANSNIGKIYINSLSDAETDTGSIREREIEYYNAQTLKSPVIGIGFIRDIGDQASNRLKGPVHQYSRTDVGIWGLANAMGYISVIWYILLTINLIKKLLYVSRHEHNDNYYISLAYIVFSIIYIPTMIFMNPFSITSEAVLMALVDYNYIRSKR